MSWRIVSSLSQRNKLKRLLRAHVKAQVVLSWVGARGPEEMDGIRALVLAVAVTLLGLGPFGP